jgi:hypothetical protein
MRLEETPMLNRSKIANCPHFGRRVVAVSLGLTAALLLASPKPAQAAPPTPGALAYTVTAQAFGTIKGRLVWGGAEAPAPVVIKALGQSDKDPEVCAAKVPIINNKLLVDAKSKGVAYGVAYIIRPKGPKNVQAVKDLIATHPKAILDQENCEFKPFVLAMHQDQELVLKSSDACGHNVRMTGFANKGLNQNLPPKGSLEVKLKAERFPLPVNCDIHPWMEGFVMVFDHPFFFVTGPDGVFEIKGIPAGPQNIVVRHESVGFVTEGKGSGKPITVVADTVTDIGDIMLNPK